MAANIRQVHSLVAFNTVLTWFKTVKYISIIPYVTTFMQTVVISQQPLGRPIVERFEQRLAQDEGDFDPT